jgi:hypothetical protein
MSFARVDYMGNPIEDDYAKQRRLAREQWNQRETARVERVERLKKVLAALPVEDLEWAFAEARDPNLATPSAQIGPDGRPYTRIGALHQAISQAIAEKR